MLSVRTVYVLSSVQLPREFPRPGTVYHYFRAWKDAGVLAELQRALHEQKSSLEQRLRVEGPNFGSLHRPGGHPPHAQTARPKVKLLKRPLSNKANRTCQHTHDIPQ